MVFFLPFIIIFSSVARNTRVCEETWASFKATEEKKRVVALSRVSLEELRSQPLIEIQSLGEDIKYLTPKQFSELTPDQIAALTEEQLVVLTRKQLGSLTIEQGRAFTARQIFILGQNRLFKFFPSEVDSDIINQVVEDIKEKGWDRILLLTSPPPLFQPVL